MAKLKPAAVKNRDRGGSSSGWHRMQLALHPTDAAALAGIAASRGMRPSHIVQDVVADWIKANAGARA
jgi:hypothetical protein